MIYSYAALISSSLPPQNSDPTIGFGLPKDGNVWGRHSKGISVELFGSMFYGKQSRIIIYKHAFPSKTLRIFSHNYYVRYNNLIKQEDNNLKFDLI